MSYFLRKIIPLIFITVSSVSFLSAQERTTPLILNQSSTFSFSSKEEKSFALTMKTDDFAEINWLANDSLLLSFKIYDSTRKIWLETDSSENDSLLFIAPKSDEYILVVKYEGISEVKDRQNVSLQYTNKFKLPIGAKQKDFRKINGYDIKIFSTKDKETESENSYVLIEKNGRIKKILKASGYGAGFRFPDDITTALSRDDKRAVTLIKTTLDKTGDGIPDVMIDYFSGGIHCCYENYFINLGEIVETVESISTGHFGMFVSGKNPKGGLLFATMDNAYAYWLIAFSHSPFPSVILEFRNGKLRPKFELMKEPAPPLTVLKKKAYLAKQQLSLEPYLGEENKNSVLYDENGTPPSIVFWGVMLDLIYTGHEALAWQYFDLVWDPRKHGKDMFIRDFKRRLSESQYWGMIEEDYNVKE